MLRLIIDSGYGNSNFRLLHVGFEFDAVRFVLNRSSPDGYGSCGIYYDSGRLYRVPMPMAHTGTSMGRLYGVDAARHYEQVSYSYVLKLASRHLRLTSRQWQPDFRKENDYDEFRSS